MNYSSKFAAIAMSGLFAVAPLAGTAWSNDVRPVSAAASGSTATEAVGAPSEIMKTSAEVYGAIRSIQAARMAIFNGTPDMASTLVADAARYFDDASAKLAGLGVGGAQGKDATTYVPFEMAMGLAEDYVPTADDADALQQANDHLARGDQKRAADILANADIGVTVTAAMVPIDGSVTRVKDAAALIGEGKYYEANLALKAIEDSIVVEAYAIDAVPAQGANNG
jgi:hypothetical protein